MQAPTSARARNVLDRRFARGSIEDLRARPHSGWIRAIRDALGMSQRDMAARLGVTGAAIAKFERSEDLGTISLATLSKAAEALDCTLVYALVPITSLGDTVNSRARKIAWAELDYVADTMALEKQSIDPKEIDQILEARADEIVDAGRLWHPEGWR